ncbi:MAG: DUF692 domain-containing protein [Bacteroidota bacterium]
MSGQSVILPKSSVGLGLRSTHIEQIIEQQPDVPWFEILLDNHTAQGGLIPDQLDAVRRYYPLSFHCVGLSLGSTDTLNKPYLATLKRMIAEYQPALISDHLCFTQHGEHHFNDLLPFPYTNESLRHVCYRIDEVQNILGRKILIENLSMYLQFEKSEMNEGQFISELVSRTGCGVLLDINNAYVNEFNHGYSAKEFIDTLPLEHVEEIHLAGFEDKKDYLIDAHNNKVSDPVWDLFEYYLQHGYSAPALIEWDNDIPTLDILLSEIKTAKTIIARNIKNVG